MESKQECVQIKLSYIEDNQVKVGRCLRSSTIPRLFPKNYSPQHPTDSWNFLIRTDENHNRLLEILREAEGKHMI